MPKAYNPLLLQQHRQNLQKARKDVSNATAVSADVSLLGNQEVVVTGHYTLKFSPMPSVDVSLLGNQEKTARRDYGTKRRNRYRSFILRNAGKLLIIWCGNHITSCL